MVLTGAGVSQESGVPTFRGAEGLWRRMRPEELATPQAFARDPRLVWEWYGWRRELVGACRPNAAHRALARLAMRAPEARASAPSVTLVTQNVDGLHLAAARELAGDTDDAIPGWARPLELHGSLFRTRCTGCGERRDSRERVDASAMETLPRCARCRQLLRPDVVWFGEMLHEPTLAAAVAAAAAADVCLVVGTSAVVQPAAALAQHTRAAGGAVIEVNPEPTPLTPMATVSLRATAAAAVPALVGHQGG
jgi:NAD-dependent deacetylase